MGIASLNPSYAAPSIPRSHVGARPAREIAGRARSYRLMPNLSFALDSSLSLLPVNTVREQARSYEKRWRL